MTDDMTTRPVFLFAPTWRCGSTYVQRLLNTGPDLTVWGEARGLLKELRRHRNWVLGMRDNTTAGEATRLFHESEGRDYNRWIANVQPPDEKFLKAARWFFSIYYGPHSARWGIKEVRCGPEEVVLLEELFPEGVFIFVVRDIVDVLPSVRAFVAEHEILAEGNIEGIIMQYIERAGYFKQYAGEKPNAHFFRYEDILTREGALKVLAAAGITRGDDVEPVIQKVVGNIEKEPLPPDLAKAVAELPIRKELGYVD